MRTGIKTLVSAIAVSSMFSFSALAVPLEIDFVTDSGFLADGVVSQTRSRDNFGNEDFHDCDAGTTDATNNCGLEFSNVSGLAGAYTTLDWGVPYNASGQSGLDIDSYNGTLVAGGGWVDTGMITHRNRLIAQGSKSLSAVGLRSVFNIDSPFPGSAGATFNIQFMETPNTSGNCSLYQVTATACDDFFTISGIPTPITFPFGSSVYQIQFRLTAGNGIFLSSENLLVTAEDSDNTLYIQARLVDIPEPLSLAILGLGLIGVGFSSRKRNTNKVA